MKGDVISDCEKPGTKTKDRLTFFSNLAENNTHMPRGILKALFVVVSTFPSALAAKRFHYKAISVQGTRDTLCPQCLKIHFIVLVKPIFSTGMSWIKQVGKLQSFYFLFASQWQCLLAGLQY